MDIVTILADIEEGVAIAKAIPLPAEGEAAIQLTSAIESIIKGGLAAYEAHSGEPYDLSNLKDESEI